MEWDLAVNEFTEAGELIPADRISGTGSENLEAGLEQAGWSLCGTTREAWDEPPEQPTAACVYEQTETEHVLIELIALGVSTWVVCRSRMAYLRFLRDWLGALIDLKQTDPERDLQEVIEELREQVNELAEAAGGLGW